MKKVKKAFALNELYTPDKQTDKADEEKQKESPVVSARAAASSERVKVNLFLHARYKQLIKIGKREEKFDSQAEFVEHIFEQYFRGKEYNQ
ncbi:hypothetical protein SAMN05421823_11827 [Catalinimonas alkaloidigena]|uniref:Uncharacterized protein n=1 Tax=Catalinimonas alkaloidigena TaxID=1075417 RepID=A0A1G9UXG0_9BACT|nr:hypothetical protein [Catalinimonas alkaloidigena]SDM64651.1 hypothetical protein SAMN05421823_11827 [Catalinimonas alkaloidigena]